MRSEFRQAITRILFACAVLLIMNFATAAYHAKHLSDPTVLNGRTLSDSPQAWIKTFGFSDNASYLNAGLTLAQSGRLMSFCAECSPPQPTPFVFWAPGTPVALSLPLKIFGTSSMWPIFYEVVLLRAAIGIVALIILAFYSTNLLTLLLGAIFIALNVPLDTYLFGNSLLYAPETFFPSICSSEPMSLLLIGLGFLTMTLSFWSFKRRPTLTWSKSSLFALTGILFGLSSLVRDSNSQFVSFMCLAFVGLTLVRNRKLLFKATALAATLFSACYLVRLPVKFWNKHRVNEFVVSTSSSGAIWRYGIWRDNTPDGQDAWVQDSGLGFGSYLDQEVAKEVREKYEKNPEGAARLSKIRFVTVLLKHPFKALVFKFERLPVLWLGSHKIPNIIFDFRFVWTAFIYVAFLSYLARGALSRVELHEVFYLYPLFLLLASVMIHFEFRYSFPALISLQSLAVLEIGYWSRKLFPSIAIFEFQRGLLSLSETSPLPQTITQTGDK